MSEFGFAAVEEGLRIGRARAAVLAADAANALTPGFAAQDVVTSPSGDAASPFSATLREVSMHGSASVLEYSMGATAKNGVSYRALADQERAMVREFKTVAEEARR